MTSSASQYLTSDWHLFQHFRAIVGGILVAFEWCICQVCCAGCLEMCCYMGAWLCGGGVNAIFGCELCVGVGFEDVTADAIEAASAAGNLCKIGPASTLNAVATIIYFILCIVLCWYVDFFDDIVLFHTGILDVVSLFPIQFLL